jgi:hypothetical protein
MTQPNLTENEKQRIDNINLVVGGVAAIGSVMGIVYAKRTGGGFWRYVGYWIAGGLVLGVPARLVSTPFKNRILTKADARITTNPTGDQNDTSGNNVKF